MTWQEKHTWNIMGKWIIFTNTTQSIQKKKKIEFLVVLATRCLFQLKLLFIDITSIDWKYYNLTPFGMVCFLCFQLKSNKIITANRELWLMNDKLMNIAVAYKLSTNSNSFHWLVMAQCVFLHCYVFYSYWILNFIFPNTLDFPRDSVDFKWCIWKYFQFPAVHLKWKHGILNDEFS